MMAGTYSGSPRSTECLNCAESLYANSPGASVCLPLTCPVGDYRLYSRGILVCFACNVTGGVRAVFSGEGVIVADPLSCPFGCEKGSFKIAGFCYPNTAVLKFSSACSLSGTCTSADVVYGGCIPGFEADASFGCSL